MTTSETERRLSELKYQGRDWDKKFYKTEVYSGELIKTYLDELKIVDSEGRKNMEESILSAAMYYETTKRSHISNYRPKGYSERTLKATIKPIENLKKQLIKLSDSDGFTHTLWAAGTLINEGKYPPEAIRYIEAMSWPEGDKRRFDWKGFLSFLDFYKLACEQALSDGIGKNAAHKSYPLETWIHNLRSNWESYSPILLSAGKYHEGVGYNSDAIHIMKKIMEPLDDTVAIQSIANKLTELNKKTQ